MGEVVPFTPGSQCAISINGCVDGATVRFTNINGKYYISVRDLIITSVHNPKSDEKTWLAACKFASQTWKRGITKQQKDKLVKYLETFQFPGDVLPKLATICVCFCVNV